jgi:serine/threonine protein kinase
MIYPDLSIKLIDFGYGLVLQKFQKMLFRYCGTPLYMAPEMIRKKGYLGISFSIIFNSSRIFG